MTGIKQASGWFADRSLAWLFGGALLLWMGGCPIDGDAVVTETVRAALQAVVDSLIDALGQYLAGQ